MGHLPPAYHCQVVTSLQPRATRRSTSRVAHGEPALTFWKFQSANAFSSLLSGAFCALAASRCAVVKRFCKNKECDQADTPAHFHSKGPQRS